MQTNFQTRQTQHAELLSIWEATYRSRFGDEIEFTKDGPSNWAKWAIQLPRILFLAREARDSYQPSQGTEIVSVFSKNIWRWQFAIRSVYENRAVSLTYPDAIPPNSTLDSIAIVEVKKLDEDKGTSNPKEIDHYANSDGAFLKKQICILEPHIILCCNTGDAYGNYIETTDWQEVIEIDKCHCYKQLNRLIIDFWHPSNQRQSHRTDRELFELLCRLLNGGMVFNEFSW